MNGIIIILVVVINVFLDGVVYISLIVCIVNVRNKNIFKIFFVFNNFLFILVWICLKNSKFIIIVVKKNFKVMICRGVSLLFNVNWVVIKLFFYIIVINISFIFLKYFFNKVFFFLFFCKIINFLNSKRVFL